jgi:UDP-glucose 4-epimerase
MDICLVTGGAGFIGSNIVEALLKHSLKLRVLDNFSTGKKENLVFPDMGDVVGKGLVELIEGDLLDEEICTNACKGTSYVFHLAAVGSVPRSVEAPVYTNDVNIRGTLNMLIAARDAKVKRFIYASSSSIYGNSGDAPKVETQTPMPASPYAVSKLAGEQYCKVFAEVYGLETVCLRYFNVFGPRQNPESQYAAVIPKFIGLALRGETLEIHGDGGQSRDFTYVTNVVKANIAAITREGIGGEVFNIACGTRITINEMVSHLEAVAGRPIARINTQPRPGDIRCSMADISKAKEKLGYDVEVDFEEGLSRTFDYFLQGNLAPAPGVGGGEVKDEG